TLNALQTCWSLTAGRTLVTFWPGLTGRTLNPLRTLNALRSLSADLGEQVPTRSRVGLMTDVIVLERDVAGAFETYRVVQAILHARSPGPLPSDTLRATRPRIALLSF